MLLPMLLRKDKALQGYLENDGPQEMPVLPLRNVVAFPESMMPLSVGLPRSIRLLEDALAGERVLVLTAMIDPSVDEPGPEGVYQIGVLAQVERALQVEDEYQIVVRGLRRVRIDEWLSDSPYLTARVVPYQEVSRDANELEALRRELLAVSRRMVAFIPQLPEGVVDVLGRISDPAELLYMIASNVRLEISDAQAVLEAEATEDQMRSLLAVMQRELEVLELGQKIRNEAKSEIEKSQREYYLRQQMKAIQKELGDGEEASEAGGYRQRLDEASLPLEARDEAEREVERLAQMAPQSAEAGVIKTYLDWLLDLPWGTVSEDNLDLEHADQVLNEDHYGLDKVKERILEFLAVRKLRMDRKVEEGDESATAILCFVGPPGVGKTSLGRSIARAMGREFTRMSLGGVRDEAEIRGHRRTYIGAMPGRVIQALKRVGTRNPVFMLDEIDKIGSDWRGDPSSALLEVLDPQQNRAFRDHYLDVDFDLSQVTFITTANTLSTIPPALLDRMEIIEIDGYTEYDKVEIAKGYLVPRQLNTNGLRPEETTFEDQAILAIIRDYTRESGVRNLEREIGRLLRKVATGIASGSTEDTPVETGPGRVRDLLGKPRFRDESKLRTEVPGVATGLAWTPAGGDVLYIEARVLEGKEGLILTGNLGDVMQESARIAMSFVRGELEHLGLPSEELDGRTVHLHVPAGAVPKDGPSAGVTLVTALASALTGRPTRDDVGMTGEVTLQGQVLPIGGVKRKVLAAHRHGLRTVILPRANEIDLEDVPNEICGDLDFVLVDHLDDVLDRALMPAAEAAAKPAHAGGGNGRKKPATVSNSSGVSGLWR
jgi:ATP-dependent Lon protease